jgi:epoxyqueuosine reductase
MHHLKEDVISYAEEIGLDLIGVTTAEPFDRLLQELEERSEHYQERYAYRMDGWQTMAKPRKALPGAKSVIVMGFYYLTEESGPTAQCGKMGRIVTYGHLGILKRARLMRAFLKKRGYQAVIGAHRKEAAVRAGLGSIGKHNLVINSQFGSWVAYQSIITDAEMEPDSPLEADPCGDCKRCLDACPTKALYEPHRLDPRKCVTYLLTSHDVPEAQLPAFENYILGCDACQEACPKNNNLTPKHNVEGLLPDSIGMYPPLKTLLHMSDAEFQRDVIATITDKMSSRRVLNVLMKNRILNKLIQGVMATCFKGKEVLPETFVHASGNLQVYKRNALVAAGNLGDPSLLADVRQLKDDPYLGPYAEWAERKLEHE